MEDFHFVSLYHRYGDMKGVTNPMYINEEDGCLEAGNSPSVFDQRSYQEDTKPTLPKSAKTEKEAHEQSL